MRPDSSNFRIALLFAAALLLIIQAAPAAAPVNDRCAGAIVINPTGPFPYFTAPVNITDASTTNDPAIPSCASDVSRSVWYIFRPAVTDIYRISTCGDSGATNTVRDTVIGIYTNGGNACGQPYSQIPWGCNDDGCGKNSEVSAIFTAGVTYYIVVWKYDTTPPMPGESLVGLMVDRGRPTNDDCTNPLAVQLNVPVVGRTLYARDDYDFGNSTCFTGIGHTPVDTPGLDVVFTFTAPTADAYSFKVKNYNLAADANYNLVLYVSPVCPMPDPGSSMNDCLAAANRNLGIAEEIVCLPLTALQQVFIFVDDRHSVNRGSAFTLEVTRCQREVETNSTPATAEPFAFEIAGAVAPVSDPDFFALGVYPPGSRAFALVDAVSANFPDFDLRVVTENDTLEHDADNNDVPYGQSSGNTAGTPLTGDCAYLRVSHVLSSTAEPYRLYAVVQPPSSNAVPEVEPNGLIAQAQIAPANYFYGTLPNMADQDIFAFDAVVGDVIFLGLDADPLRNRTPIDAQLELLNSAGSILMLVDDPTANSNTNASPGTLSATSPSSPAETILCRASYTGRHYARVLISSYAPFGTTAGDYLLSITRNGFIGSTGTNTPPAILNLSAPSVPQTNDAVVSGLIVDPEPGPNFRVAVNWGDLSPLSILSVKGCDYAFQAAHRYQQAGSFQITVAVQDAHGATRSTNTIIEITNPNAAPANIRSITYRTDRSVLIDVQGTPGATYRIEVCDDLKSWSTLATRTADSAGKFQLFDGPPLLQRRFYRVIWP